MEELSDLVFSEDDSSSFETVLEDQAPKESKNPVEATPNPFKVDGRNLTPNEILFERFFQGKFDADEWLKKVGIKF